MKAFLILEDGHIFTGTAIGAEKEVISEIVFNTSMTGYLEILTDPSYAGQAVVMTYPLIGNYGVCYHDMESVRVWADGLIVREISRQSSNFRSMQGLDEFLKEMEVTGIAGIDTRALTKVLRENGTMNGMITIKESYCLKEVLEMVRKYRVTKVVSKVTVKERYTISYKEFKPTDLETAKMTDMACTMQKTSEIQREKKPHYKIALMDFGSKRNIEHCLLKCGCDVTVYPANTKAEEILKMKPDGIMLSNGSVDPAECVEIIAQLQKLYQSEIPIFAICLGHQLMALANGSQTEKMKYGHRGANHPVKDLRTGRVYLSSQNHGYVVVEDSIDKEIAQVWFINANDKTIEGLLYKNRPIITVQFHPEACSGSNDSEFLFDEFMDLIALSKRTKQKGGDGYAKKSEN